MATLAQRHCTYPLPWWLLQVVALREERLDLDEVVAEVKKTRDGLLKDMDSCSKKRQVVEATLSKAQQELDAFQVPRPCWRG